VKRGLLLLLGIGGDGAVRDGVDAEVDELLAKVRVPVVLDLVVRAPREPGGDDGPLVAEQGVEVDDEAVLVGREVAALEVGAEVVDPAEAAGLAAAEQARRLGEGAPAAVAVRADVGHQPLVLLLGPRALVRVRLLAARRPPHLFFASLCCGWEDEVAAGMEAQSRRFGWVGFYRRLGCNRLVRWRRRPHGRRLGLQYSRSPSHSLL
jgi:hypothetical protein